MIVPSIDLMDGRAVQLVGGAKKELDAGDPRPLAAKFGVVGEIAVIDLDAALGRGDNATVIEELLRIAPCRVGGGIRDADAARSWLDRGATKVILGTAAVPEVLQQLPPQRVITALDAIDGEIVVEGWKKRTGVQVEDRIDELAGIAGGFLLTFVEREGRMVGMDHERVRALVERAAPAKVTVAGGIATAAEVAAIDALGADAQVGMGLYTGKIELADVLTAMLKSDRPDGLWTTIVCDEYGGSLGLVYSNAESLAESLKTGRGVYHSRRRGLWRKGETSGSHQELRRIELDCDRDAMRFLVQQHGTGFCHLNTWTCFGHDGGMSALARRIDRRHDDHAEASFTSELLGDADLLRQKLVEKAADLVNAEGHAKVAGVAADLLYFTLVACARGGVSLAQVEAELDLRARRVGHSPGRR